jgi:hypothetical protein
MLCAKLGHWPFENPPHKATCGQVNLLSMAFLEWLPKQPTGNMMQQLDKRSMRQWRKKLGQPHE